MTITLEWWWFVPLVLVLLGLFAAALAQDELPVWIMGALAAAMFSGHYL